MKVIKIIFYVVLIALMATLVVDFQGTLDKVENMVVNIQERTEKTRVMSEAMQEIIGKEIDEEYGNK